LKTIYFGCKDNKTLQKLHPICTHFFQNVETLTNVHLLKIAHKSLKYNFLWFLFISNNFNA